MVDSERLIIVIESFPCIWNTQLHDYHNKNLKDLSWNNVCQEVIDDWHLLSQKQRNIKFNEIKKRWNNIRDYYKKELQIQKNVSTGQPAKKRKKYVFFDMLEFLRPVFELKDSEKSEEIKQEPNNETVTTTSTVTLPTMSGNSPMKPVPATPVKTPAKLNAFETAIIKALENKSNLPTNDDADLLFLKSLLPDFKELTGSQKVDFKIGVMQLLRSLKNSDSQSPILDNDYKPNFLQNMQFKPIATTTYAPMAANSPTSTVSRSPTPTHINTACNNSNEAMYILSNNTDEQSSNTQFDSTNVKTDDELKDESDSE